MSDFCCTNCGRETAETEHHVRLSYADTELPGGCVRIRLDVFREGGAYFSRSTVLGTSPQRRAARLLPDGPITM